MFYSSVFGPKAVRHIWQIREDLSPYFSLIISKCLTNYNYRRENFKDEIFEIFQCEYDENVKPVLELRKKKRESREKVQKLLTFVLGAFFTIGLFIYPFQKQKLEGDTSVPIYVLPIENKTNDISLDPIAQGITQEIIEGISYVNPVCVLSLVDSNSGKFYSQEESTGLKNSFVLKNEIRGNEKIEFD